MYTQIRPVFYRTLSLLGPLPKKEERDRESNRQTDRQRKKEEKDRVSGRKSESE